MSKTLLMQPVPLCHAPDLVCPAVDDWDRQFRRPLHCRDPISGTVWDGATATESAFRCLRCGARWCPRTCSLPRPARVSLYAGYATAEASGRDGRASYATAGAPVGKKLLSTTNKRRVSFLRSGVSPGSFSRHHGQACWNGEGLLAQRRNAVYDPEQRKQRPCGSIVGDDQMITPTPFIGIADVGSCEATLTVGDLQTGDAVAWLDLRIAHNEWLDKIKDRAERRVIGSTSAMRVDIEAHPGDRLTRSRSTRRVLPSRPARRQRVATDRYPRAGSAGARCPLSTSGAGPRGSP